MILVDSCVLFDHLRAKDPKLAVLFSTLPIAICGVIQAEVLHGSRNPTNRANLLQFMGLFPLLSLPDAMWITVGDNLNILRRNGLTVPFVDVVLATLAVSQDLELWTRDAHFERIQQSLPALKLFQEPA